MEEARPRLSPHKSGSSRNPFYEATRVPARVRGARLFRIRHPEGGFHWEAETVLNGTLVQRRFEYELHARAWLLQATQPLSMQGSFDLEELNGRFRAACFAQGA